MFRNPWGCIFFVLFRHDLQDVTGCFIYLPFPEERVNGKSAVARKRGPWKTTGSPIKYVFNICLVFPINLTGQEILKLATV